MIPSKMLVWTASLLCFACVAWAHVDLGLLTRCETSPDCCACVATPGCSWMYGSDVTARPPRCAPTSLPPGPDEKKSPSQTWKDIQILTKQHNKRINLRRKIFIRPQWLILRQNVGIRQNFEFEVMTKTKEIQMKVFDEESAGGFNFTVTPASASQCLNFSGVWHTTFKLNKKTGLEKLIRTFYITCSTRRPRQRTRFRMVADTPTCQARADRLRVVLLPWATYRAKAKMMVRLVTKCECPCLSKPDKKKGILLYDTVVDPNNGTKLIMKKKNSKTILCKDKCTFPAYEDVSRCRNDMCSLTPYAASCSGRGTCMCGECVCDPGYTGLLCECSSAKCPEVDGAVCGGPSRGRCVCGGCLCHGGRGGAACQDDNTDLGGCMEHRHHIVPCSGRGVCTAGQCVCPSMYSGQYCQNLDQCPLHRHCVRCFLTALATHQYKPFLGGHDAFSSQDPNCDECAHDPTTRFTTSPPHVTDGHDRRCTCLDEAGCSYSFTYFQTSHVYGHETILHVNETVVCGRKTHRIT